MGHSDGKQTGRRLLGLPAKRLDEADGISRVLKKADRSDTGGACGEAGCDIFQRNSTDGEDGNVYGATDFGETLKSLGAPNAALEGVAKTGPKNRKSAPAAAADWAASSEWQDTPTRKSG